MRVLIVSNCFPPLSDGAYERAAARTAGELHERGLKVAVLTSEAVLCGIPEEFPFSIRRELRREATGWNGVPSRADVVTHNERVLRRLLDDFRPAVVWVWNPEGLGRGFWNVLARSAVRTALMIADVKVAALPEIPRRLPAVFLSADLLAASLPQGYDPALCTVIPPWTDIPAGAATLDGDEILFVGKLDRAHGVDDLLEACAGLDLAYTLTLVGPGDLDFWRRRGRDLVIRNLHVIGPVARLDPWYRGAAVLAAPGRVFEASSHAPIEAMAWGVPVIVTPVGDHRSFRGPESRAIEVPVGDVGSLRAALRRMLGSLQERRAQGARGRDAAKRLYAREVVSPRILTWLFDRVS